jgi:hypothetical protein
MKNRFYPVISTILLAVLILIAGCGGPAAATTTALAANFTWPDALHFAATGSSGEMKMLSWASVMQAGLGGPIIRVVNEPAWTNAYRDMAQNRMVLCQIDKSTMRDSIEALNEYATPDGGPWPAGLVWVDSLAATGFMVRGNSGISKPEDIRPGMKIAIWNDKSATMTPFLALLAWAGLDKSQIVWVNTGNYDACPRAVVEGRADICMAAPVSPAVMESSNAPGGVSYIALDPAANPGGAAAFLELSPLYNFGPINVGPKNVVGIWGILSYKYLGAHLDADTELIYRLVRWLDENYEAYKDTYESNVQMTRADLLEVLETTYMPVHPGLIKYLEEKGLWSGALARRNEVNTALLERYISGYQDAMARAGAQGVEVKPNNPAWIKMWEDYKVEKGIPVIQMHVSLAQDALPKMPAGYVTPETQTPAQPPAAATAPSSTQPSKIPFEVVSIDGARPGSDVTVMVKTVPGAEVKITFMMPSGAESAYPSERTKIAGPDGTISWTWNINSRVPAGEASLIFNIKSGGVEETVTVKKII